MTTLEIVRTFLPLDARNMLRDRLLRWIPVIPLLVSGLIGWGLPALDRALISRGLFSLERYYPLAMSLFVLTTPGIAGLVVGFLILDEKDDHTLDALRVTPLPLSGFLLYRVGLPAAIGFLMTVAGYRLAGLAPIGLADLLVIGFVAALSAPLLCLALAVYAPNKVAGFALMKALNGLTTAPLLAYFLPPAWQLLVAVVPTYWPMKMVWLAAAGKSYWLEATAGIALQGLLLWFLLDRFRRRMG